MAVAGKTILDEYVGCSGLFEFVKSILYGNAEEACVELQVSVKVSEDGQLHITGANVDHIETDMRRCRCGERAAVLDVTSRRNV